MERYIQTLSNIIVLQSVVRRRIAAKTYEEKLVQRDQLCESSSISIQRMCRGYIARVKYLHSATDIITCQSIVRRMMAVRVANKLRCIRLMKEEAAATLVQSIYRGYNARISYIMTVSDVIVCQNAVRRVLAVQKSEKLRLTQLSKQAAAASKIQCVYRGFFARINYFLVVADVIKTQSAVRKWIALKQLVTMKEKKHASTIIQREIRRKLATSKFQLMVADVILCQSIVRRRLAINAAEKRRVRLSLREQAATKIASTYKMHAAYNSYNVTVVDIIICQCFARRWIASRRFNEMQCLRRKVEDASTTIGKNWRGFKAKTDYM